MSTAPSFQIDVNSIAQSLLHNEAFLMSLSQNTIFVKGLSQNDEFVSAVSKNPVFINSIQCKVNNELECSFDARLAMSELKPIKRLAELEQLTGIEECYDDDEHEPTIPEQIQEIQTKLNNVKVGASESPSIEIKQKTKTGKRAMHLIKTLMASGKGHLTHAQIRTALSDETLEDCRITPDCSNPRRIIIDALNEAERICSSVLPDKKGYGRHEWRLLLKS